MANLFGALVQVSPTIEVDLENSYRGISGVMSPAFSLVANLYNTSFDARSSVNLPIPAVTSTASCGGRHSLALPAITLSANCYADYGIRLSKTIPAITLSANIFQESISSLDAVLPAITISALMRMESVSSLSRHISAIALSAKCFGGIYSSLNKSIGAINLTAASYETALTSVLMSLPAITLDARMQGIAADIIALALNAKNFGLTKYTNYDYNSMCMFNGKTLGLKRTGIYELAGSDDDGTAIPWKIRTGKINLSRSGLRYVWVTGKISGDLKMIVETADGERYEYDVEPVSETEDSVRVKVGKGLRSEYVTIEFQNESNETVIIDKIQGYGLRS